MSTPMTVVVAFHARSGIAALNVVTAALEVDPRTAGGAVRFAKTREQMAAEVASVRANGEAVVAAWSFYSPDFGRAAEDLAWVRANAPSAGVLHVAGGVHATAEPRETLRAGFDLVAVGEGEGTMIAIVHAVATGEDPRTLRGTAHLDDAGRLVSRGAAERRPLDDFPAVNVRHGKWNPLEITRGCVYACSFCQTPFMFKARFRHRSVENVRAHVRAMAAEGARFQRFVTPTALSYGSPDERVDLGKIEALLAAVRDEVGPGGKIYFGTFPSECRPEHVTPESLAVLKRFVDNDTLVIGAQSGSLRVLEATRRGHDVETIVRAVRYAIEAGFRPDVDFLLGLPGETLDDRQASVRLAEELVAMGARIHSHAFMPLPGTPLKDREPSPIEPPIARAMGRMEAEGAMHGQWRRQVITAAELVERRRAARARG